MLDRVRLSLLLAGTAFQSALLAGGSAAQDASQSGPASGDTVVLDTIVVNANGGEEGDKHAGAADRANSVYVSQEDLRLTNPQSLKDVFSGFASISVGGGIGAAQKVYVNSIDELNLAVTVDGVLQNNRVFHHNTTNYIGPTLLKSVRVDPGVAPADAGPGALGGSIVYETVDVGDLLLGDRSYGGFASISYDTNSNTFTEAGSAYGRYEGFELLGYIKYANGDNYSDGDGNDINGTAADFLSFLGKAAFQSTEGHRFEFSGQQVQDHAFRPYRANFGGLPSTEPETRRYEITQRTVSANYGIEGADGLFDPSVVIGYSEASTEVPYFFHRGSGTLLNIESDGNAWTWSGKAENTFNIDDKNSVTAGIDFYNAESKYSDAIYSPDGYKEKARNIGFYAQARVSPIERVRLSFGGRGDQQWFTGVEGTELDNFGLSGNVYAEVDLNQYVSVNAGYSNVFGGIDLEENYIFDSITGYDGLKPVRSQNLIAGAKIEYRGFSVTGDVYQTDFFDYREYSGALNVHNTDFHVQGFKIGAGYNWDNGFVRVSYSNSDLKNDDGYVDSFSASETGAPIGQIIAAEIVHTFDKYDLTVGSSIDAALEYDGPEKAGYLPVPGYFVANAFAEYKPERLEHLTLRLEANNIFDETYAERSTYGVEYGLDELTPLYEPGRSFLLKAKLRF
ncbi:MAG: TonB-dependent receptor [Pseudomonadota bacterium]